MNELHRLFTDTPYGRASRASDRAGRPVYTIKQDRDGWWRIARAGRIMPRLPRPLCWRQGCACDEESARTVCSSRWNIYDTAKHARPDLLKMRALL